MINKIKEIRQQTGVSLGLCEKALKETDGDIDKAKELLRKWGQALAGKRGGRDTREGLIESYIHANKKLGVLLSLGCETDFVARNKDFQELAHKIALHIAAMNPIYVGSEDIPNEVIEKEKEIYQEQMLKENKSKDIMDKVIEGKLEKYRKNVCLLLQPYVQDDTKSVQDLINEHITKTGENIIVNQFVRLEI
jgi:elongation factor Ts